MYKANIDILSRLRDRRQHYSYIAASGRRHRRAAPYRRCTQAKFRGLSELETVLNHWAFYRRASKTTSLIATTSSTSIESLYLETGDLRSLENRWLSLELLRSSEWLPSQMGY